MRIIILRNYQQNYEGKVNVVYHNSKPCLPQEFPQSNFLTKLTLIQSIKWIFFLYIVFWDFLWYYKKVILCLRSSKLYNILFDIAFTYKKHSSINMFFLCHNLWNPNTIKPVSSLPRSKDFTCRRQVLFLAFIESCYQCDAM